MMFGQMIVIASAAVDRDGWKELHTHSVEEEGERLARGIVTNDLFLPPSSSGKEGGVESFVRVVSPAGH